MKILSLYDGKYEATSTGKVYSNARTLKVELKGKINKYGYRMIILHTNDKKRNYINVHRIVAELFIPNPNNYPQVNHKNGDESDNRVENLEWCNSEQNHIHCRDHLKPKYCKINMGIAKQIRIKHKNGISVKNLCSEYGLKKTQIGYIILNKRWKEE